MEMREEKVKMLNELLCLYSEQCGISAGYRTVLWDMAWQFMEKYNLGRGYRDLKNYGKRFLSDWDEIDAYDVIVLKEHEYPQVLQQMIEEGLFAANPRLLRIAAEWKWNPWGK